MIFALFLVLIFFVSCDDDFKKTITIEPNKIYQHQLTHPCYIDNWEFQTLDNECTVYILLNGELTNTTSPPVTFQYKWDLVKGNEVHKKYAPKQTNYWFVVSNTGKENVNIKFSYSCDNKLVTGAVIGISVGGAVILLCFACYVCLFICSCCVFVCFICNCSLNLLGYIPQKNVEEFSMKGLDDEDEDESPQKKNLLSNEKASKKIDARGDPSSLSGYYQSLDQFRNHNPVTEVGDAKKKNEDYHIEKNF